MNYSKSHRRKVYGLLFRVAAGKLISENNDWSEGSRSETCRKKLLGFYPALRRHIIGVKDARLSALRK